MSLSGHKIIGVFCVALGSGWLSASPALAHGDELDPIPARALAGHSYPGEDTPSQIRFINVRSRPVRIMWVGFNGVERQYAKLAEGEEIVQPTFVSHRWLVRDLSDGSALEGFISTRSYLQGSGSPQIAIIR